jgi:hypothetical protein
MFLLVCYTHYVNRRQNMKDQLWMLVYHRLGSFTVQRHCIMCIVSMLRSTLSRNAHDAPWYALGASRRVRERSHGRETVYTVTWYRITLLWYCITLLWYGITRWSMSITVAGLRLSNESQRLCVLSCHSSLAIICCSHICILLWLITTMINIENAYTPTYMHIRDIRFRFLLSISLNESFTFRLIPIACAR